MKSKINKLAKKSLYYDDTKNSENEKETLLKKQLMKASESEKLEEKC